MFDDMYFPPEERRGRGNQNLNTWQKGTLVAEYLAKFISLERFAPSLVSIEKIKADRFFEGLIYLIKQGLTTVKYQSLDEVVSVPSRDKRIYQTRDKTVETYKFLGKKHVNQKQMGCDEKKPRKESNIAMRAIQGRYDALVCAIFKSQHCGECKLDQAVCFSCGYLGHMMSTIQPTLNNVFLAICVLDVEVLTTKEELPF